MPKFGRKEIFDKIVIYDISVKSECLFCEKGSSNKINSLLTRIIIHYFFYKTSVEGAAPRNPHKFDAKFYIIVVYITEFPL